MLENPLSEGENSSKDLQGLCQGVIVAVKAINLLSVELRIAKLPQCGL